ncbi:MAG: hypothetical protein OEY08_13355 [Gammaproteobacteria bacterium]|nr:hypothetical protein [Gammaproteobacteria bacterium]
MILFLVDNSLDYANVRWDEEYTTYFMLKKGVKLSCSLPQVRFPIEARVQPNSGLMNDFLPGPGGTFLVSEEVRDNLALRYAPDSTFCDISIEGVKERRFVWLLNRFAVLVEPGYKSEPGELGWSKKRWLPANIREIDIVRESRYVSRWFCVDQPVNQDEGFYRLVRNQSWTGLTFKEVWNSKE